jgi:hypothetical protein
MQRILITATVGGGRQERECHGAVDPLCRGHLLTTMSLHSSSLSPMKADEFQPERTTTAKA